MEFGWYIIFYLLEGIKSEYHMPLSGGELLKLGLLDTRLIDTFWPIQPVFTFFDNCLNLDNPAF
jgi:hypothetical protein